MALVLLFWAAFKKAFAFPLIARVVFVLAEAKYSLISVCRSLRPSMSRVLANCWVLNLCLALRFNGLILCLVLLLVDVLILYFGIAVEAFIFSTRFRHPILSFARSCSASQSFLSGASMHKSPGVGLL